MSYIISTQFSEREMNAWHAFLNAASANNVSPWSCEEQVIFNILIKKKNIYISKKSTKITNYKFYF